MSVKETARRQQVRLLNQTAKEVAGVRQPAKGWLATLRSALGMSGADVARRLNVTRSAVHQAERNEREGAITLNQLSKNAEAMGGRLVYAIVPESTVEELLKAQARTKAEAVVTTANTHMALEAQDLPEHLVQERIEDLARALALEMPKDFWKLP